MQIRTYSALAGRIDLFCKSPCTLILDVGCGIWVRDREYMEAEMGILSQEMTSRIRQLGLVMKFITRLLTSSISASLPPSLTDAIMPWKRVSIN